VLPFSDRLTVAVQRSANPVVVGLDPRYEHLPPVLRQHNSADRAGRAAAFGQFCRAVIDVVAPLVPVVKPQMAFFEELGPPGLQVLSEVVQYARQRHLLVILDGKRNDIGTTAAAYARAYLGPDSAWGGDALTVSPYLGTDSLTPFVETATQTGAGVFVLVKTSNPGGRTFQDRLIEDRPLYRYVGELVDDLAGQTQGQTGFGDVGAVVGATYPAQLAELRQSMPRTWLLVPGYGSQGGTAEDVQGAFDDRGLGAIINNSRGIIFAYQRPEFEKYGGNGWQRAVEEATREMIEQLRQGTPAGRLATAST
jgi:orotidine-5'-phosphate decarboxylase